MQIHDHSKASAVHGTQSTDEHGSNPKTLATEKNADTSDQGSVNSSEYSGDENSVQQARAVPIIFSGKAKLVDVRPPRGTNTAASANQSTPDTAVTSGTTKMTDREAELLGAEDADRYVRNAMNSQTRPANVATEDPFIDPAYQNLLAKPANEIAAKEMKRLKAAREAGGTGGGLMERMTARMDYGPPSHSTALGGNPPTDKERAYARALTARLAAGRVPKKDANTTARGQLEGC